MPLSEYEQRVLHEMEQQLRSDDPTLAESFSGRSSFSVRRLALGSLGVIAGLTALVAGVALSLIWLGVVGFLLMLGGVLYAVSRSASGGSKAAPPAGRSRGTTSSSSLMDRLEQRWDDRRDGR